MEGLAEGVAQVRFAAEDEGKAVDGISFTCCLSKGLKARP